MRILSVILRVGAAMALIAGMAACNYRTLKDESNENPQGAGPTAQGKLQKSPGFAEIESRILGPHCLSCHNSASSQGGLNLDDIDLVQARIGVIYERVVVQGNMPPGGGLPADLRTQLKSWIDAGAPEVGGAEVTAVTRPYTFNKLAESFLQAKCLICHSGERPEGEMDLTTREQFVVNLKKIFSAIFVEKTMPLAPLPNLSQSEKMILLEWISLGSPE